MKIVVAADNSLYSKDALEYTLDMIVRDNVNNTTIILLSVVETVAALDVLDEEISTLSGDWVSEENERLTRLATTTLTVLAEICKKRGVTTRTILLHGNVRASIEEEVKKQEADLLIVGSRGMGVIKSLLIGSVSEHLVRHCSCPVLVVRKNSLEARKDSK